MRALFSNMATGNTFIQLGISVRSYFVFVKFSSLVLKQKYIKLKNTKKIL